MNPFTRIYSKESESPDLSTVPSDPTDPNSPEVPVPGTMGSEQTSANTNGIINDSKPEDLEFVPNPQIPQAKPGQFVAMSRADFSRHAANMAMNAAKRAAAGQTFEEITAAAGQEASQVGQELLTQSLKSIAGNGSKVIVDVLGSKGNRGNNDGGPGTDDGLRHHGGGYVYNTGLDYSGRPVEVKLNTGIVPNCYTPIYKSANPFYTSPLHMTGAQVSIPNNSYLLSTFFNDVVSFTFTNAVQASVSFNINTSLLAGSNLSSALNVLLNALQVYFFFDSILMYGNNPQNRNDGMLYLRSVLTATDINNMYILRRLLLGTPIPPNMLQFTYYLMHTFQSSSLADAPLIKMCPVQINTSSYPDSSSIVTAYTNLQSYQSTFALISRACPHWLYNALPNVSFEPLDDPNFHTIWCNLPYQMTSTVSGNVYSNIGPSVSTMDTTVSYNSFTNNLDGAAYALTTVYNTANSNWAPTLLTPVVSNMGTSIQSNRYSYNGSNIANCYGNGTFTIQRNETYSVWPSLTGGGTAFGPLNTTHNFGTSRVYGVTGNTITQTAMELCEWLCSLNDFNVKKEYSHIKGKLSPRKSNSTSGTGRSGKRRGKTRKIMDRSRSVMDKASDVDNL
jgi:hypothetical protein